MQTIKMKWTGVRPLIMHNGRLADPLDEYTSQIKEMRKDKRAAGTDSVMKKLVRLEWEGSLYWSESMGPVIPSDNIERCVQLGAQKIKKGKDVMAAVFCAEPEVKLEYDGPRALDAMHNSGRFVIRKGVVIKKQRIIRIRPMFPTGWSVSFALEYDNQVIDEKDLVRCCEEAGALVGLGDWRPKFGRFVVEVLK